VLIREPVVVEFGSPPAGRLGAVEEGRADCLEGGGAPLSPELSRMAAAGTQQGPPWASLRDGRSVAAPGRVSR